MGEEDWTQGEQVVNSLVFYVNGKRIVDDDPDPTESLLTYLRVKLLLPGSKLGCGEGGCGACTVCVSKYCRDTNTLRHWSANACLLPVVCCHGLAITTVEGIGNIRNTHPVQERLAASHGTQCGFCTPGFVMSMYTLLRNHPKPTQAQIHQAIEGNLCRCTGYRPILDGLGTFSKESYGCPMGEQCCKNQPKTTDASSNERITLYKTEQFKEHIPDQELIFPSELQLNSQLDQQCLGFSKDGVQFYRPTAVHQVVSLKAKYPEAKLVVGNTELGIEMRMKNAHYPVLVQVGEIPEMTKIEAIESGVTVGASATLTSLQDFLQVQVNKLEEWKTRSFTAVLDMLKYFAGVQIRNVACMAGNIMTASPISDLNPVLVAVGATLTVQNQGGARQVKMDKTFFTGYRRTKLNAEDVLIAITIPYTEKSQYVCAYKQAQRKEDDIAIVNCCINLQVDEATNKIQDTQIVYGGMAPTTVVAEKASAITVGRTWDESLLSDVVDTLSQELHLQYSTPGGRVEYRVALCNSFFFKFFVYIAQRLFKDNGNQYRSCTLYTEPDVTVRGVQIYEGRSNDVTSARDLMMSSRDTVGEPVAHLSSVKHTTGEAVYVDDMPRLAGELTAAFVLSSRPHARILDIDTTHALAVPGVVGYADYSDIPGSKEQGFDTDIVFSGEEVKYRGQAIGVIVAETKKAAQQAARLVKVTYEDLPAIITIEDAIKAGTFHAEPLRINRGDVSAGLEKSLHTVSGEVKLGGQEHFYLETQSSIVVPQEDGGVEAFVSTQSPEHSQTGISKVLGVAQNKVHVRARRAGGAFGGKETQSSIVLLPVAVAANKFKRPVRCMLDRNDDMVMTGTRHPYLAKYQAGFDDAGKLTALRIDYYSNGGCTQDASMMVMARCLQTADNAYHFPADFALTGYACKTNLPSNTAFRGFGVPQAVFIIEEIMDRIAKQLHAEPKLVREVNMYAPGEAMHYGQYIDNTNLDRCYQQVITDSDYTSLQQQVEQFNREHRWVKQGLAIVPNKYTIGIGFPLYNQGAALVNIYKDGSVLLYHHGCEMGQGLHTKMVQIASKVLQVPVSYVQASDTSTSHVPNGVPTCASMASDIQGMAVKNACEILRDRIQPFKENNPEGSWEEWVMDAINNRTSLSATGYHRHPTPMFDWSKGSGDGCVYSSYGAAVCQVQIDCLTGDHQVLSTDIVMDLGKSLNPAIDIGQIEGGFMQGYGLFMIEEQRYSPDGYIFSQGPGAYKIPSVGNIPKRFNVRLLKDSENEHAVYSSKAIGEPPMLLSTAVYHAVKHAIYSARSDEGLHDYLRLDSPATPERIRMACTDRFTNSVLPSPADGATPWCINP